MSLTLLLWGLWVPKKGVNIWGNVDLVVEYTGDVLYDSVEIRLSEFKFSLTGICVQKKGCNGQQGIALFGIWGVRPLYLDGISKRMQKVYASACRFQEVTRGQKSILRYLLFEWNILCTALAQNYIKQFKMHTCSLGSRAIESRVIAIASCDIIDNLLLLQSPLVRNHPRINQAELFHCPAVWGPMNSVTVRRAMPSQGSGDASTWQRRWFGWVGCWYHHGGY